MYCYFAQLWQQIWWRCTLLLRLGQRALVDGAVDEDWSPILALRGSLDLARVMTAHSSSSDWLSMLFLAGLMMLELILWYDMQ